MQYAKAYAALIGSIATALLAVFTADTTVGKVLTVVAIVATTVGTWAVENAPKPTDERGEIHAGVSGLVALLLVVALILWILSMLGHPVQIG